MEKRRAFTRFSSLMADEVALKDRFVGGIHHKLDPAVL
jgi:hypothetical protein